MAYIDQDRFKKAFFEEAGELLESLNEKLLDLEKNPKNSEVINEIFRLTHSIKGESAIVGYMNISELAHKMEDIFEKIRKAELPVNTEIINVLLKAYDKMMEIMSAVQNDKDESLFDISNEINNLSKILKEEKKIIVKRNIERKIGKKETDKVKDREKLNKLNVEFSDFQKNQIEDGLERGEKFFKITVYIDKDCEMKYPRAFLVYNNFLTNGTVIKTSPDILTEADDLKYVSLELYLISSIDEEKLKACANVDQVNGIIINKINLRALKDKGLDLSNVPGYADLILSSREIEEGEIVEKGWERELTAKVKQKKDDIEKLLEKAKIEQDQSAKISSQTDIQKDLKKQTIRVDTDRLDILMNLVGELIINHSRFSQIKNDISDQSSLEILKSEIDDAINDLERISDQMQVGMMLVRMVPIGTVFSKFPRMIRDLANSLHKKVNLVIEGEETEIDRAIVELITEPLTHLIRNCLDHGIEMPDERVRKGKQSEGTIILKAFQQGSNIYIEVIDDGKGISIEKIKEKAVEKGLVSMQWLNQMNNDEIINIIFEPGFSTKEEITGLSGRGVGMDVVRSQVKKLRGNVNVETKFGSGTKITIELPLTLTIVEALLITVGDSIFAIPVSVIEETLKIRKDEIKDFDEYKVYNLRNETVAILFLSELVGIESQNISEDAYVVMVFYERRKIGIVVDDLIGNQDIVIKALDESLKMLEGISGATVLGDGKIAIILDINSLVKVRKREIDKVVKSQDIAKNQEIGYEEFYDNLNKSNVDLNKFYDEINNLTDELFKVKKASLDKKDIISEEKGQDNDEFYIEESILSDSNNKQETTVIDKKQENLKKKGTGLLEKANKLKKDVDNNESSHKNNKIEEIELDLDNL